MNNNPVVNLAENDLSLDYPTIDNVSQGNDTTNTITTTDIIDDTVDEIVTPVVSTDNIAPLSGDKSINNDVATDKFSNIKTSVVNRSVWTSDITISDHVNLEIPGVILAICNFLRSHTSNNEFSILCKGSWDKSTYVVSDEYVIPIQRVDHSSVYYDDADLHDHRSNGYNVVIHCHPFKSAAFSATDNSTINAHFDVSILYSEGEFTTAVIPIVVADGLTIQMKPQDIVINWSVAIDIPQSEIDSKISIIGYNSYAGYNNYGYNKYTQSYPKVVPPQSQANNTTKQCNIHDKNASYHSKKWDSGILPPANQNVNNKDLTNSELISKGKKKQIDVANLIDVDGLVAYIDDLGKFIMLPFDEIPQNALFDEFENAFVSPRYAYYDYSGIYY